MREKERDGEKKGNKKEDLDRSETTSPIIVVYIRLREILNSNIYFYY